MGKTAYDIETYRSSHAVVIVFGIVGNILVVVSILRQKKVLKNNYYFLVVHLAICDLGALIIFVFHHVNWYLVEDHLVYSTKYCAFICISYFFQAAGPGMMLIISLLRYRATVHPLKPAISRQKLKVVCGLVYLGSLIAGYGVFLPQCFLQNDSYFKFRYFRHACTTFFLIVTTIFMAVVYYKIGQALMKQNKYMKRVCSNPVRRSAPSSSFKILKFIRNRRTFLVCLITVLCFVTGHIPMSVWYILCIAKESHFLMENAWIARLGNVLLVVGVHSVNPLIYGILDKRLLTFWKFCRKKKQRPQGN
ncbi:neuropeptide FF receptor 2-like [Paramuricea clavata]|uniref:Neuropeptide FF receptor 2-like n=1 Tax=Paramuricea clavata TaxID=317549 RepID=A0A6S7G1J6_PARCT|nr:neuropeptide FF receptor 2-like [Paramuricea clavata]